MANVSKSKKSLNPAARNNLLVEHYIAARQAGPSSGYDIRPVEEDNFEHYYILVRPLSGIYEGHTYMIELKTKYGHGEDEALYPIDMPYVRFNTTVFHVNVSPGGGAICVDFLKDRNAWVASNDFNAIMQNILILFGEPNNLSPWNTEASKLWKECELDYKDRKKMLDSKSPFAAIEAAKKAAFMPFSKKALSDSKNNDLTPYKKYFPQLWGKEITNEQKLAFEAEQKEFDKFAKEFSEHRSKKKNEKTNVAESKSEAKVESVPRWKKRQA
jgi:ubiquitin-protein ligase